MSKARMQRQRRQRAAVFGDQAPGIERAEQSQERLSLGEAFGVGLGEKGHVSRGCPPEREVEGETGKVRGLDLGGWEGGERALFAARPEPVGRPRRNAAPRPARWVASARVTRSVTRRDMPE